MGRDRKVIEINKHHFTKKEMEVRKRTEEKYKINRDELKPLDSLTEEAKVEFERIVKEAFWLDNLDRNDLNLYCFYWSKVKEIVAEASDAPEVIEMRSGDGCPKMVANPLRKAIKDYHGEMRKISAKLGLTSIDRLKLAAPQEEKKISKFSKYL